MAVRSRSVFAGLTPTVSTNVYTVPLGRTLIIHTITLYMTVGGTDILVGLQRAGTDVWFLRWVGGAASTTQTHNYGGLVLNPGDILRLYSSNAANYCTVSGTLLVGAPS